MGYNWSGSLDNENSSASVDIVFSNSNRATDGDVYDTTMRIDKSFNYNAGTIHINASGIKVLDINTGKDVQEFSSIGTVSVGGSSKTLDVGGSVSFDINYHMGSSITIAFNCSLNSSSWEIYAGTITASWSGASNNCSYSFKSNNSFYYTGSSQTILNSYEAAYLIASGQSATEVGDYTCTLTVKPQYKATHCLRDTSGKMTDSVSQSWHITKANPKWTISPSTMSLEINKTGSVTIEGEFTGIKNVSQYSSNGGKLNLLGLYKDTVTYRFSGVSAGTVVVTIDAPENNYYYSSNKFFTVIVSENREDQNWYYENTSVTVGNTAYIYRQYQSGGNKVSTKTPSCTVGNSSVISATVYNDGRIAIKGKQIGTSSLTVSIDEDDNYKYKSDTITVTVVDKQDQNWTFQNIPSEMNVGDSKNALFDGGASSSNFSSIDVRTSPVGIINTSLSTDKKTITLEALSAGTCTLTITVPGDSSYKEKTQTAYITVGAKKDQTWEANISETTIKISEFVDISVFGSIYGGLYFFTESSLITITNKTDTGCRVIAGNSTGTAKVRLYSPGTTAYNDKEVYITIHIKDDLIWVECNPHIYKNGKWIEMSPKIYKNGKWLSGIIKKYISKGDIYGK